MSGRWEPGAKAVIVVTEHPDVNLNRIVVLERADWKTDLSLIWAVTCVAGKKFKGYGRDPQGNLSKSIMIMDPLLGIEQWKLRLLSDDDETIERDEIQYVKEPELHV